MTYRDDRQALRERAEVLESDLEAAERRLREAQAKVQSHEEKDAREEKELEALRREVARLRPVTKPPAKKKARMVAAVAVVIVGGLFVSGILASILLRSGGSEPSLPVPQTVPVPVKPTPAEPPRTGHAIFGALVVEQAKGSTAVGSPCLVHALLAHSPRGIRAQNLTVRCKSGVIYDAAAPIGPGIESRSGGAIELTAGDRHHYILEFGLTGQWPGERPQLELVTDAQRARLWREGLEPTSTALYLDDLSFARAGMSLDAELEGLSPMTTERRPLTLIDEKGDAPAALSGDCELRVHPAPLKGAQAGQTCRVIVRCGGEIIYGGKGQGWNRCQLQGDAIVASDPMITSSDGDPALELDATRVTLSEGEAWKATLRLEPSPCLRSGTWRAYVFGAEAPREGELLVDGAEAQLTFDGDTTTLAVPKGCPSSGVVLSARGQPGGQGYDLSLGPGFRTAGGTTPSGEPLALLFDP